MASLKRCRAASTTTLLLLICVTIFSIDRCSAFQIQRPTCTKQKSATALFYQPSERNSESNEDDNNDLNNHPFNRRRQQEEDQAMAFQRKMDMVRELQLNYYTTSTSFMDNPKQPAAKLDTVTGKLQQLPLWRDSQTHVPGRSHVLEIADPIYTNMFESILYKPQPWCFGHLYMESEESDEGKDDVPSTTAPPPLSTWSDVGSAAAEDEDTDSSSASESQSTPSESSVLGCLMHIADYRRMSDGRLLLLVHAMERFVVTDIVQELPYSIVNAQVLPDVEEIDPLLLDELHPDLSESDLQPARAMAVQESVKYHAYEYDPHHSFADNILITTYSGGSIDEDASRLGLAGSMDSSNFPLPPLPPQQQIQVKEHHTVNQAAIAKVLPFCPFSKTPLEDISLSVKRSASTDVDEESTDSDDSMNDVSNLEQQQPSFEYRLLHKGILQVPPTDPDFSSNDMTLEELEYQLWLAMNHFLVSTKLPVSPVLLSLLPPETEEQVWPSEFLLDKIASNLQEVEATRHDFVVVSPDYPSYRRQRRLSFSAAYLLEDYYESNDSNNDWRTQGKEGQSLKALLLSIPSTKQRLRVVLEKFLQWQQQAWGEFQ